MAEHEKATAIEKALELLLTFAPQNAELGTTELSEKLGYHKATTSRILLTLTDHGFLRQNSATKKFSLGPSIQRLSSALDSFARLRAEQGPDTFMMMKTEMLDGCMIKCLIFEARSHAADFLSYWRNERRREA